MMKQLDNPEVQLTEYQSFVVQLLFYVRKVAPEYCNAICELSQFLSHPLQEHWNGLTRLMGYVKHSPYFYFKLQRPLILQLLGMWT